MLTSKQKMKDGEGTQEKADEENQLTSLNIPILFFKRKKSGYHPSAKTLEAGRGQEGSLGDEGEANSTEPAILYSPGVNFDRAEYELRDTGRISSDSSEVSYKSFLISNMAKRAREEALADLEHDSVQECASLDYSI